MSKVDTDNLTHNKTVTISEGLRQAVVAAASTPAAIRTAEITHYRTCLASARANNCGVTTFMDALRELGVGGA